eukprot:TRINITY_DN70589_c0_g1_i1.p1 TRINITY_DN70589_c0_g1~~TRINITY_DN70589_c0_g1_i1.p1  ORF type:complete len:279 (-),score=111.61 TRINITY_DN70589_c0_g1_i1:13-828(-)
MAARAAERAKAEAERAAQEAAEKERAEAEKAAAEREKAAKKALEEEAARIALEEAKKAKEEAEAAKAALEEAARLKRDNERKRTIIEQALREAAEAAKKAAEEAATEVEGSPVAASADFDAMAATPLQVTITDTFLTAGQMAQALEEEALQGGPSFSQKGLVLKIFERYATGWSRSQRVFLRFPDMRQFAEDMRHILPNAHRQFKRFQRVLESFFDDTLSLQCVMGGPGGRVTAGLTVEWFQVFVQKALNKVGPGMMEMFFALIEEAEPLD